MNVFAFRMMHFIYASAHAGQDHSPQSMLYSKLQALVYNILCPTTAMVDYAISLQKLSANEQFFGDAQTTISL